MEILDAIMPTEISLDYLLSNVGIRNHICMKKIIITILILIAIAAAYIGWKIFGPTLHSPTDKYLYIKTGSNYQDVKNNLLQKEIITSEFLFDKLAKQAKYDKLVKAGRYEITNGMSLYNLIRMLKSGSQAPVRLVINKLRTKEDLAKKIGQQFECDSLDAISFLNNNDSLKNYGLDTQTVMTAVIPNTYLINWNYSFKKLFSTLKKEEEKFWNKERKQKAADKKLAPAQVYIMASIVEEESNKLKDKPLIASVYINRINKGMKLEADPTVKYAMRDFGLKRILYAHLSYPSSYNTYQNTGLPPGPICTPSAQTIDAVLDAPQTDYIFFVAKPDFNGYSNFASTYTEHLKFAKAYQQALDELIKKKQAQ